jgi:RNA polymerase sigma-70 factor (ECF subfamily)
MLDRLDPVERAVFLMADVFAVPYIEISDAVDKSPDACRQIASRARRRLRGSAPSTPRPVDRAVVDELLVALWMGDMPAVLARLAPDATCVSDGGASRRAARRPVAGAERVAAFLLSVTSRHKDELSFLNATVNGDPGIVGRLDTGEVDLVMAFELRDGAVSAVRIMRNPDKLRSVETEAMLL